MTKSPFLTALMALLFSVVALAQGTTPQTLTDKLPANSTVTDSAGRTVTNGGTNANGSVKVTHTGKMKMVSPGEYRISGEITLIENPASQGSEGPITVNTNGKPTEVVLEKNGTDPGGHIVTNVNGGKAIVHINGNFNDANVGGGNNHIDFNGRNNTATGQPGSGGTVSLGGRGNSFNSGGGQWTVR